MQHLTTVLGTFHGRVLAARLGAEGIPVDLRGLTDGPYPLQGEVDIYVMADQIELAREILLADAVDDVFSRRRRAPKMGCGGGLPGVTSGRSEYFDDTGNGDFAAGHDALDELDEAGTDVFEAGPDETHEGDDRDFGVADDDLVRALGAVIDRPRIKGAAAAAVVAVVVVLVVVGILAAIR